MTTFKRHPKPCWRNGLLGACVILLALRAVVLAESDNTSLRHGVWERILARLEALPTRWDALPAPAVPPSRRLAKQVLDAATEGERQAAFTLITRLALAPPEARAQLIARARQERAVSEVDLWLPESLADDEQLRDIDKAGLTIEAWLELAEQLGRRDVLQRAAGAALSLALLRIPPARLAATARRWSTLSPARHGTQGAADVNDALGRILYRIGHNREALDAHRHARQLYRAVNDKRGQGNTWVGEADVLARLGQYEAALQAYRQAFTLYADVSYRLGQGRIWPREAFILFHLGQHDAARQAYRQAHSLLAALGDKRGQGDTWLIEAQVLFRLGQHEGALQAYRQARSKYIDVGAELGEGNTWAGEAEVLFRLGQHEGALQAYRQARALFDDVGDKLGQGNTWQGEAMVVVRLGQFDGALQAYRQARALYTDVGEQLGQGNAWWGEAFVLNYLGQHEGALQAYRQARTLFAAVGNKLGQGNTWIGEGEVLFRLGRHDGALQAYRQARTLFAAAGNKLGQGLTWWGEADVLLRLEQHDSALQAYRQARTLFAAVGEKVGQGLAWKGEADVLLRRGALGPALRAAENAGNLARDMGAIPNELDTRITEARILLARKQEARAIGRAEDARALLRRWRQSGVSDLDRTAMADWSAPYDLLIPLLARRRGRAVEQALALAEEAHAPVLLDLLATGSRRPEDTNDPPLREERQRLQHERATLDRKLEDAIAPGERQKLQRERAIVDAQLELNELVALGSLRSTFVSGTPIDAKARAALVRDVGAILLYYVAEDQAVAFLLQPGQRMPLVRFIGLSREQLQREVQALRHDLSNPPWEQDAHGRQRALFDQLVAPFAAALEGTSRLTIIPHGPLHELPFEALLVDDTTALFERWHVSIAPSLSALHAVRARRAKRKPAPNEIAFVGIAGGTGLKLSGPAIADVGAGFGAAVQIVSPGPGSYGAYLEHAPRARHLLVATHGTHVAESRSGHVELAAAAGHSTRLTASDIAQNPLRAELVTLAACETARGEAMLSDERLDLTRAFLIAGAGAVLATRWKVPEDERTRLFLLDFYQALRQGGPGGTPLRKDEALTEARRRARERGDDAQLWAAWVLVGDAR
jgi:CHAT domain-containing protein/tetratricopeptide (TPR) repeat protein